MHVLPKFSDSKLSLFCQVNAVSQEGCNALMYAVHREFEDCVSALLRYDGCSQVAVRALPHGYTALIVAIHVRRAGIVRLLLRHDPCAQVTQQQALPCSQTPLMKAAAHVDPTMVQLLLQHPLNGQRIDDALHSAAQTGTGLERRGMAVMAWPRFLECVELLLRKGAKFPLAHASAEESALVRPIFERLT